MGPGPTAAAPSEPTMAPSAESWDHAIAAVIASATAGAPMAVIPRPTIESLARGYRDPFTSAHIERLALLPAAPLSIHDPWCSLSAGPVHRGRLAYYADVTEGPILADCCSELGEVAKPAGGPGETFEDIADEFRRRRRFVLEIDAMTGLLLDAVETYRPVCPETAQRSLTSAVVERSLPLLVDAATPAPTWPAPTTSTPAPGALLADLQPTSRETFARMEPLMAAYPLLPGTQ